MIGPTYAFNWSNDPSRQELDKATGPKAKEHGFQTCLVFGWLGDPVEPIYEQSIRGAGLNLVQGTNFLRYGASPLDQLLDIGWWRMHLKEAHELKANEWALYLEGACGMNDCNNWSPIQARMAASYTAMGCRIFLEEDITPILYGPCYRPNSFFEGHPYSIFIKYLFKFIPYGARLFEFADCQQDGTLIGRLGDHPIDPIRYPASQSYLGVGGKPKWGGIKVDEFFKTYSALNALYRAIYYGDQEYAFQ